MGLILQKFPQVGIFLALLTPLHSLLRPSLTLIPSHVRREANKVVDKLANEGVSSQEEDIMIDAHHLLTPPLLLQCIEITLRDCPLPDGVTTGTHAPREVNTPCLPSLLFVSSTCSTFN
jgi:hypothetical protein